MTLSENLRHLYDDVKINEEEVLRYETMTIRASIFPLQSLPKTVCDLTYSISYSIRRSAE